MPGGNSCGGAMVAATVAIDMTTQAPIAQRIRGILQAHFPTKRNAAMRGQT
jgi:hypothetical protein